MTKENIMTNNAETEVKQVSAAEKERIRQRKLSMACYCPKVNGASWNFLPKRK